MAGTIYFGENAVTKIDVLRGSGTDRVSFTMQRAPTPFPELDAADPGNKYPPHVSIEVRQGYAEEWIAKCFGKGHEIVIIDTHDGKRETVLS